MPVFFDGSAENALIALRAVADYAPGEIIRVRRLRPEGVDHDAAAEAHHRRAVADIKANQRALGRLRRLARRQGATREQVRAASEYR